MSRFEQHFVTSKLDVGNGRRFPLYQDAGRADIVGCNIFWRFADCWRKKDTGLRVRHSLS